MKFIRIVFFSTLVMTSFSVSAGKPPSSNSLSSPPIFGSSWWCVAANQTDHTITLTIKFRDAVGTVVDSQTYGTPTGWSPGSFYTGTYPDDAIRCEVEWEGQPDDVRASVCSFNQQDYTDGIGCFELR
jgi:hypothetical protein